MSEFVLPVPAFQGSRSKRIESLIGAFPDPRQLAARLSRVLASEETWGWAERTLVDEENGLRPLFAILCKTLAESEFLTSILAKDPELLTSFVSEEDFSRSSGKAVFEKELVRHLAMLREGDEYSIALARFRLHEIFRVAVRDITDRAPIETLARELSDLADLIVQAAYEKAYAEKTMALGVAHLGADEFAEMAVVSMGKHGSGELNFSSDLDLILLSEGEDKTDLEGRREALDRWIERHPFAAYGPVPTLVARTRPVTFETFFHDLATRMISMLSDTGPFGAVYRIDMRLRPEGDSGPLVRDVESAITYYQNWGERWERQALLRARCCAGKIELGERFEKGTGGVIFRKYVDPTEVEETLRQMRNLRFRSIAQAGADADERSRNVKNGPGGIRDIEFLVQAVQGLYGGEYPELRLGNLFELLRRIHQSGLIGAEDFSTLSEGYDFLRRVEHRVQMDDLQRYHLPKNEEALEKLAVGLGYRDGAHLSECARDTMEAIHAIFKAVFRVEEEEEPIGEMLETAKLADSHRRALESYGLTAPEEVFRSVKRLAVDKEAPHLNSKLRRLLKSILPRLLAQVRDTPRPDWAWKTFEDFSLSSPARATTFSIAEENPRFLELVVTLGAASSYLSEILQTYPRLRDDLVNRSLFDKSFRSDTLEERFRNQEGAAAAGLTLSKVRSFRTRAEVHVAGRFVLGLTEATEATTELSDLAEFCLAKCIEDSWRFGSMGMVLFGLGKMGGKELGFRSDLDAVILFDSDLQSSSEIPHRLAGKLQKEMNLRNPDGRLFELDLKLRPHGKNGPLITSVDAALDYYREEGQTWERLALTRCRPLWGERGLAEATRDRLLDWVFEKPADDSTLAEVRAMRDRIEREKKKEILKTGPGGLLDVEFVAQAGQLKWGATDPSIRSPNTGEAIRKFAERGLLGEDEAGVLVEGYLFLRDLENRLSLLGKKGARGLPSREEDLVHLVGCLNLIRRTRDLPGEDWTPNSLARHEAETRRRIREVFDGLFDRNFEK